MAGAALAALIAASGPAWAQSASDPGSPGGAPLATNRAAVAPAQGASDAEVTTMVLEASVNGSHTHQLLTLKRRADGSFIAIASELRALRFKLDPTIAPDAEVPLSAVGIESTYDEANQGISLQAPADHFDTFVVALGGETAPTDLDKIHPLSGFIVNYSLYGARYAGRTQASGNVEALAMTRMGVFSTTGLFNSDRSYGAGSAVRLDSSWRLIDPRAIRSYTLGDYVSNALAWSSSVRLGGFQIASAFDQRPDIVTTALPQFSGSAALPSTLDLYVNQQRIYSGQVPAGPFDLRSLPYVSGGNVRLVATDMTGRQVEMTKSYYYVSRQLRKGMLQYSLDVGAPRLDYGRDSFNYDNTVFASGSVRYGVNGALTLEGHAEGSADGLINGGFGVVKSIGGVGAITASFAGSRYKGRTGGKYAVELEGQVAGVRLYAATERTIDDYFDLARVAIQRDARRFQNEHQSDGLTDWLTATAQASRLDRAGLSFTPWFDRTSISLSYNRIVTRLEDQKTANLSLSRSLTNRISVYANGFADLNDGKRFGLFATLNIRLGNNVNASAGVQHDSGRTAYVAQANGGGSQRQGAIGWGVSDREYDDGDAQRSAYLSYRAPQALLRAQVDQSGSDWRGTVQAEGSIVAAGGGVFLANRIGDAFAIVHNAGPGTEVLQGGVPMGKADRAGRALLPNLIPYYEQRVLIDPTGLPDGWEADATERLAVAGYRQGAIVDFGAKRVYAAIVVLHRPDGTPVPAGYAVRLDGGETTVVGYDGQVYLRGLAASNRVSVDLGDGAACSAQFAFDLNGPAQPQIGPLTCR